LYNDLLEAHSPEDIERIWGLKQSDFGVGATVNSDTVQQPDVTTQIVGGGMGAKS